jgi:hypothetical protein
VWANSQSRHSCIPKQPKRKSLKVNSFSTTPLEIVAEIEKQTGEKWAVPYTSLEKLRDMENEG